LRDLGGLPTRDGRTTRWGAVVRADALDRLTETGWAALVDYGVRTIIDLRNEDELGSDATDRPPDLRTIHLPLDGIDDREFWDVWEVGPEYGTPLYYGPHIERFPHLSARVIEAIADAPRGGVVVHCGEGRDRTGQITMLLLSLVGVPDEVIVEDYLLSHERLSVRYRTRGEEDQYEVIEAYLRKRGTSYREVIKATLASIDVEERLRAGGLAGRTMDLIRERLM
jgi:protein tyrosine/serine phosphatase